MSTTRPIRKEVTSLVLPSLGIFWAALGIGWFLQLAWDINTAGVFLPALLAVGLTIIVLRVVPRLLTNQQTRGLVGAAGMISLIGAACFFLTRQSCHPDWSSWGKGFLTQAAPLFLGLTGVLGLVTLVARFLCRSQWGTAIIWGQAAATAILLSLRADRGEAVAAVLYFTWVFLIGHGGVLLLRCALKRNFPWHLGALTTIAILGWLLLGLAHLSLVRTPILAGLALAPAGLGALHLVRDRRRLRVAAARWSRQQGPAEAIILGGLWLVGAVGFINACAPETVYDATWTHLPFTMRLLREGGLRAEPLVLTQLYHQWAQTFWVLGYGLIGEVGAKWLAWVAPVLLGFTLRDELHRLGLGSATALGATLLCVGSPFFVLWSSTCYYDLTLAAMTLAAIQCLRRALSEPGMGQAAGCLGALFLGTALALKYTSLILAVTLVPVALLTFGAPLRRGLRVVFAVGFGAALVALPWYATVFAWTGNPVFPFLNGTFGSPLFPADRSAILNAPEFRPDGFLDLLRWPWRITFETDRAAESPPGAFGVSLLVFFPLLLWVRSRAALGYALLAGGLMLGTGWAMLYVRYWLPALPLLTVALAAGWTTWRQQCGGPVLPEWRLLGASLLGLFAVAQVPFGLRSNYGVPEGCAVRYFRGQESRAQFLKRQGPVEALAAIPQQIRPDESVIVLEFPAVNQIHAPCYPLTAKIQAARGWDQEAWYETLFREKNARFLVVDTSACDKFLFFLRCGIARHLQMDHLVQARNQVRVYDLKQRHWMEESFIARYEIVTEAARTPDGSAGDADCPCRMASAEEPLGKIVALPPQGRRLRVLAEVQGDKGGIALLDVDWCGPEGQVIERDLAAAGLMERSRSQIIYAGCIPEAARQVHVRIRPWGCGPIQVESAILDLAR